MGISILVLSNSLTFEDDRQNTAKLKSVFKLFFLNPLRSVVGWFDLPVYTCILVHAPRGSHIVSKN